MDISGDTKLVGILGDPVSHSLSPRMHNAAYDAMGLDICYVPLPVDPDDLKAAVYGLKAVHFLGANVTIPHKVAAVGLMDRLAETAVTAAAVNTVVNDDGVLVGHNTDGAGFIQSLEEATSPDYAASSVLIIGAGGAARSVTAALAEKGVPQIAIVNRSRDRARELQEMLSHGFPSLLTVIRTFDEDFEELFAASKIIINATPAGISGNLKGVPAAVDKFTEDHVVCDIAYANSQETSFLAAAREKGATTMGGMGMLIYQGAAAIRLWTGMEPPINIMRHAVES